MKQYRVEFRYYTNSEKVAVKSFESLEEMNQYLMFMPIELRQDAEVYVWMKDTSMLMEDYLFNLLKKD
jgi:hypothetical protein